MPLKTYPLILPSSSSHLNPNILLFGLLFMLPAAFADGTKDKGQFVQGLGTGGKSWLITIPVYPFISLGVALAILAPTC